MLAIERAVALGATPTFAELPDHVLGRLAGVATEVTHHPDESVMVEGAVESWMFVLLQGSVRVEVAGRAVAHHGPGAVLGELAVLDPAPRSATVVAEERCHLLRLDHQALRQVMNDHPVLTTGLVTVLARRLRLANLVSAEAGAGLDASPAPSPADERD